LSLAIKETISFDSRVVAVVIAVPFIASEFKLVIILKTGKTLRLKR
jgi:hypothetical protein